MPAMMMPILSDAIEAMSATTAPRMTIPPRTIVITASGRRPRRFAALRAIRGDNPATPKNTRSAPKMRLLSSAFVLGELPDNALASRITPRTSDIPPMMTRRFGFEGASVAPSLIAATGGIRPARQAGSKADTSVTRRPTASAIAHVLGVRIRLIEPSPPPWLVMILAMSHATPRPATAPTKDPMSPRKSASITSDANT